ncbi:MAG: sensor domain-containing diguanylate cyclase [Desulfovibrio sp.]|nr:sensor domain-containing diguanylate cyclase [Desulfovibrio sp.]
MRLDKSIESQSTKYDDFINSGRTSFPLIQTDPFNNRKKMLYILSRISDEVGKVVGMCGVGIMQETIQEILRSFEQQYNVKIHLTDWDGKSMFSSEANSSDGKTIKDLPQSFRQNREFAYTENDNGGYTITRYLNDIGWFVVIKGERIEGKDAFTHIIVGNIIAIVVIFLLLFLAMHFLMRSERTHLKNKAFTDELTGIANRAGFEAAMGETVSKDGENGALFILDLDHFKEVNDNLGHPTGDLLLKQTAKKLQSLIRASDIVARLGGDEFVVYCSGFKQPDQIAMKAENIRQTVMQHYDLPDGLKLTVSTSIGIALYPAHGNTYDLLYKNADKALYASKEGGRNRFTMIDGSSARNSEESAG